VDTIKNKPVAAPTLPTHVLIVDRHQIVRQGLAREIAKTADLRVVAEASDGYEAVALARRLQPDVIVMDAYLPGLSGVQVIRQLRQQSEPPVQPAILVLSAYGDKQYVWSMLASGAMGYLLKDETMARIIAAIRQVAGGQAVLSAAVQTTLVETIRELNEELSAAEVKVLTLVAKGMSNKEIAGALAIAEGTVRIHLNNLYRKVPLIRTRAEATAWAWINRIVPE
jgi:DNA-binding NarL/FixJ family response regulator